MFWMFCEHTDANKGYVSLYLSLKVMGLRRCISIYCLPTNPGPEEESEPQRELHEYTKVQCHMSYVFVGLVTGSIVHVPQTATFPVSWQTSEFHLATDASLCVTLANTYIWAHTCLYMNKYIHMGTYMLAHEQIHTGTYMLAHEQIHTHGYIYACT